MAGLSRAWADTCWSSGCPGGVGVALRALAADGRTLRHPSRQMKAMCDPWARGGLQGSGWEARDYSTVGRFRHRWGGGTSTSHGSTEDGGQSPRSRERGLELSLPGSEGASPADPLSQTSGLLHGEARHFCCLKPLMLLEELLARVMPGGVTSGPVSVLGTSLPCEKTRLSEQGLPGPRLRARAPAPLTSDPSLWVRPGLLSHWQRKGMRQEAMG